MNRTRNPSEDNDCAFYQARLPLSARAIELVAKVLRKHLKEIGSRWRKLPPGKIAVIVLAILRHDQRLADMAGDNGISAATGAAGCSRLSPCSRPRRRVWSGCWRRSPDQVARWC